MKQALGLIETVGLATAIEAADAAMKSANVTLIGIENSKGGGLFTIKLQGDVGAVQAAIQSASQAASRIGTVYAAKVIPRPGEGLDKIIFSKDTIGFINKEAEEAKQAKEAEDAKLAKEAEGAKQAKEAEEAKQAKEAEEAKQAKEAEEAKRAKEAQEAKQAKEAEEAKKLNQVQEAKRTKEAEENKKIKKTK